jgi:hypothetical protein
LSAALIDRRCSIVIVWRAYGFGIDPAIARTAFSKRGAMKFLLCDHRSLRVADREAADSYGFNNAGRFVRAGKRLRKIATSPEGNGCVQYALRANADPSWALSVERLADRLPSASHLNRACDTRASAELPRLRRGFLLADTGDVRHDPFHDIRKRRFEIHDSIVRTACVRRDIIEFRGACGE